MPITDQSKAFIEKALDNTLPEFKELETQLPQLIQILDHEEKAPPGGHPFSQFHTLFFGIDKLIQQLKTEGVSEEKLPTEHEVRGVILERLDQKLAKAATAGKSPSQFGWHKGKYFLLRHLGAFIEQSFSNTLPDEEFFALEYKDVEASKKPSKKDYFANEIKKINDALDNECKEDNPPPYGKEHPYYNFSNIFFHPELLTDLSKRKKSGTEQLPFKGDVRKFLISLIDEHLTKTLQAAALNPLELGWDKEKLFNRKFVDDKLRCTTTSVDWEWHIRRESRDAIVTQQQRQLILNNYVLLCGALDNLSAEISPEILRTAMMLGFQNLQFDNLSWDAQGNLGTWGVVVFLSRDYLTLDQAFSLSIGLKDAFLALGRAGTTHLTNYLSPEQWSTLNALEQRIILLPIFSQGLQGSSPTQAELLRQRIEGIRALSEQQKKNLFDPALKPYITTLARLNLAESLSLETIVKIPRFWYSDHPEWIDEIAKGELTEQQLQNLLQPKVSWYVNTTDRFNFVKNLSNEIFNKIPIEWWTEREYEAIMEQIAAGKAVEKFIGSYKVSEQQSNLENLPRCRERIAKGLLSQNGFLNLASSHKDRLEEVKDDGEFSDLLNKIAKSPENRLGYYFPEVFHALGSTKPDRISLITNSDVLFNLLHYGIFSGNEFCEMSDREFELWKNPISLTATMSSNDFFAYEFSELRIRLKENEFDAEIMANFNLLKALVKNDLILVEKSAWGITFSETNLMPFKLKERKKEPSEVTESLTSPLEQKSSPLFFKPALEASSTEQKVTENPLLKYSTVKDRCTQRITQRYTEIMKMPAEKSSEAALKALHEQCSNTGLLSVLSAVKEEYAHKLSASAPVAPIVRPPTPS